jgi:hypothetical protein
MMRTPCSIALLLVLALAQEARSATRVALILNEVQSRAVPWPVTTGVPFPQGKLTSPEHCRLVDDAGTEHPLQAKASATWDGPRGSIRWLTIDFIATPGRKFFLEFGDTVKRRAIATPLRVTQKDGIHVDTGELAAEFSRQGAFLSDLRLGQTRAVSKGFGELYYLDHKGRRASSAHDGADRKITVEAEGPVRACLRVDGFYGGPGAERRVAFRTRYHFFAGLGLLKVANEFRIIGSTKDVRWKDIGIDMRLSLDRETWNVAVDGDGEPGNQIVNVPCGPKTRSVSSYQATYRHYGNPECRGAVASLAGDAEVEHLRNERVGEWMQVSDGKLAVTGSMQWFSQQFPAEWQATPDGLTLHVWSPRGGELDFGSAGIREFFGEAGEKYLLDWKGTRAPQTPIERFFFFAGRAALDRGDADGLGINKHHQFFVHFAKADQAKIGQEYGRLVARPPLALASGAWNASTGVMGPIAARPNDSPDEAVVDRLFDLSRDAQDSFGDYGWWLFGAGPHYSYQWDAETKKHYADPRRFEYHTYQRETQQWWNYLRSGERKFFEWALPAENHWVDIAVAHRPTKFFTEYRGGEVAPATLHWPRGDWAIDSTIHFLRHHDTGEAWLRGQSQFWATYHRTLETTTLAYYLTGDERYQGVIDYWREYFSDLAGKTSASNDFQPWHREQAWHRPTKAGETPKSWAVMIRDYAPFNSGSRHQQTLFFNLATLYEHTWDPKIGLALREYADAFLDPEHSLGVWRSQDNRAPIRAEAPIMAHYWIPALWRYARATNDPRMPKVLDRYFKACLGADPFQGDVGVYSNCQIGYAYAFSKDPRHLRAAAHELEHLRPNAKPLAKPQDLGERLYNPYAPIRAFAGVPRLVWAIEEAKKKGVSIPPPALTRPQRAPLAWRKSPDVPLTLTLWGFDRRIHVLGPDGQPFRDFEIQTRTHISATQPFDRTLPGFEVYEHRLLFPKSAPAGWYLLVPHLELALLDLEGGEGVWCQAEQPIAIHSAVRWYWKVPQKLDAMQIDCGQPKNLRLAFDDGRPVTAKLLPLGLLVSLKPEDAGSTLRIEGGQKSVLWFRFRELPADQSWVATTARLLKTLPPTAAAPAPQKLPPREQFIEGRFGKAVVIRPGQSLSLPDHAKVDGVVRRFFDVRQGTLEFWVKTLWDDRLTPIAKPNYLTNGLIEASIPWKLPMHEWAHVSLVWRPLKKEPKQVILHVYVNGVDQANYRSLHWQGYSNIPASLPKNGKWLEAWIGKAALGAPFALDELRLSRSPRYVDLDVEFGGQQTVNPHFFIPSKAPFRPDDATQLLFHFDGDLQSDPSQGQARVEGRMVVK